MKKRKLLLSVFLIVLMVTQLIFPLVVNASDEDNNISLDINLNYNRETNNIERIAKDSAYDIINLKYVKKYIAQDEYEYFEESHEDIYTIDISNQTDKRNITTSFKFAGYGTYTVYVQNADSQIFLGHIKIADPKDAPTVVAQKDSKNPLHINITARSNTSTIEEIKIAKIENTEKIDFSKIGTLIEFEKSNNVTLKYEEITEEGCYQIYVKDADGNSGRTNIYLGENYHISSTSPVQTIDNSFTFDIDDKYFDIESVKVAKLPDNADIKDKETQEYIKNQGTTLDGTQLVKNGKSATITYKPDEEGIYVFYILDKLDFKLYTTKTFIFEDKDIISINISQSESNPKQLTIKATDKLVNISEVKFAIGENISMDDIEANGTPLNFTEGKTVTITKEVNENCMVNVYVKDTNGNKSLYHKSITGINSSGVPDPTEKVWNLNVTGNSEKWTNNDVTLHISGIDTENKNVELKNITVNGTEITLENNVATYSISKNGTYTITATDNNTTKTKQITVDKIDKVVPTLEVTDYTPEETPDNVILIINANDELSGIDTVTINDTKITLDENGLADYTITANGTYTIVATDNAGNKQVKTISIDTLEYNSDADPLPSYLPGDVNDDGKVNIQDVLKLRRHIATKNDKIYEKHPDWYLDETSQEIADINKDGKINIQDVLKLRRYIAAKNDKIYEKHPEWAEL